MSKHTQKALQWFGLVLLLDISGATVLVLTLSFGMAILLSFMCGIVAVGIANQLVKL